MKKPLDPEPLSIIFRSKISGEILGADRLQSYLGRFNPVMSARLKLVYISLRIIREILCDRNIKPYKRLNKVSGS